MTRAFFPALTLALALVTGPLAAQSTKTIAWRENVSLRVGQSAVIYGYRGDCGQPPTKAQVELPATTTGTLSLGKPGVVDSNRCGGLTPAVEIIFTAKVAGRETFELNGDAVSVRVRK